MGDAALYIEEALRADLDKAIPSILSDAAHSAHAAVSFTAHSIRLTNPPYPVESACTDDCTFRREDQQPGLDSVLGMEEQDPHLLPAPHGRLHR